MKFIKDSIDRVIEIGIRIKNKFDEAKLDTIPGLIDDAINEIDNL